MKILEIEINKDELVASLNAATDAKTLAGATHLPIEVCQLITDAYSKGFQEYAGKYFDLKEKYNELTAKVCEKYLLK